MATTDAGPLPQPPPDGVRTSTRPPRSRRQNDSSAPQSQREESNARGRGGLTRGARGARRGRGRGGAASGAGGANYGAPGAAGVAEGAGAPSEQTQSSRRNRPGRARGTRTVPDPRTANGRMFGGQLTQDTDSINGGDSSAQLSLQADAPAFVPGVQHPLRDNAQSQKSRQRRRLSKSTAPDIATRTHHDIDNGHYECAICTSEVLRNSKVWSCRTCWTVFHLKCIKTWSQNERSTVGQSQQNLQNGDLPPPRQWRCPGCNLPKDTLPKSYSCWCEKEVEPRPVAGIPPHSCGNTCGKERVRKCPHPCQLTCHAGPCPPCTHMGPLQMCFCGKHEATRRCLDTDYENGWSCGERCGDIMPCGEHTCPRPCHEGFCGACEVRVEARCYCGQVEKAILCADRGDELPSRLKHHAASGEEVIEEWTGMFQCSNPGNRSFDCDIHVDQSPCHAQDAEPGHCPRSPDVVSHCPCGKTALAEITEKPRTSCQDPIPNCTKPCGKNLPCGHPCLQTCHLGRCLPCTKTISINCRCGRTTSSTLCHQGTVEAPQCMRFCRTTLNCGRHACDERCCTGERKATERMQSKRKARPLASAPRVIDNDFEAEHICTRACGRPLKCGNHECEELCHKGPCPSCREAVFDEISCHCGRTVLQPPLPCGTQPPPCRFQCNRPKTCGHPQVQHSCHMDQENCPKCPFLVEKRCMCGKKTLKNQQCWLQNIQCGEVCGKKLKCGSHFCRKLCHRPGECEDTDGRACQQPCGKPKTSCGHPDEAPCHAPFPCKEEKPCPHKIFVTCECQAQKQEFKCNATKSSEGNLTKTLPCNDECARLERNRKLALALNIDTSSHVDGLDHIPYSNETLTLFQQNPSWAQQQEREFRVFANEEDEKRLRFKPMKANERAFIHSLAEDFAMDSESMDPEPHRHVLLFKSPRFVAAPNKTLAECARIRATQRAAAGKIAGVDAAAGQKPKASNEVGEAYNGFLITRPRFALTIEEVRAEVLKVMSGDVPLQFDIEFLPNEEIILKAMTRTLDEQALDIMLKDLKTPLAKGIAAKALGSLQLCHTDTSLNVTRREADSNVSDGWSRVAAKGAAPKRVNAQRPFAGTNAFSALGGNKVTFAKKPAKKTVKAEEIVADDWEAAEAEEEEKERAVSGVNSGAEDNGTADTGTVDTGTESHTDIAIDTAPQNDDAEGQSQGQAVDVVSTESAFGQQSDELGDGPLPDASQDLEGEVDNGISAAQ